MGRRIDRAALGILVAVGYYLFFLYAWGSIPLACALAFASCALTRMLLDGLNLPRRASRLQARAELMRLAALDESAAQAALTALVRRRWPEEDFRLAPVLKHPEATMSSGDVLNAWKANRGADRLVIAATCPCEPRASLYARGLRSPAVAVVDAPQLLRILRRCSADVLPPVRRAPLIVRLQSLLGRVASARVTPRNALVALALLAIYLATGNAWCLFPSLALLLYLGVALFHRRAGRALFADG